MRSVLEDLVPHPLEARLAAAWMVLGVQLLGPHVAESQKLESLPIVERSIAFHGGDVYLHSEVDLTLSSRSGSFELETSRDGGLFDYTVTRETEDGVTRYRHTNDSIEKWVDGIAQELTSEEDRRRARDYVSARVYFPFLPFRLADPGVYKEDLGLEEWQGRTLRRVRVSFEAGASTRSGDQYLYWFDPESGRLEQFAYSFDGGLRFRPMENYRRVEGILLADSRNYAVSGEKMSVDAITPEYVAQEMELLSTVRLENIRVRPR